MQSQYKEEWKCIDTFLPVQAEESFSRSFTEGNLLHISVLETEVHLGLFCFPIIMEAAINKILWGFEDNYLYEPHKYLLNCLFKSD